MPISGSTFTYTNPTGATGATPGQVVQSAVWNQIHEDLEEAMTQVASQLVAEVTNRNILCANGGFDIWQLGAGDSASIAVVASTTAYTADRWYITTGANQAHTIAAEAPLSGNSRKCARIQRNASETGTGAIVFGYPLDTAELNRILGRRVTLSFLARTGANWSPASGTFSISLYVGTGGVAKRGGGFTGETTVLTISTNLAAGSAITAITGSSANVVPTTSTQGEVQLTWTPAGTAGANDYIELDDVQPEAQLSEDTWLPTEYDRIPFEDELALCKRYFNKTFNYGVAPAQNGGFPGALTSLVQVAATRVGIYWQYPVEMRTTASVTTYNPAANSANWINASVSVSVVVSLDTTLSQSPKCIYIHSANTSSPAAGTIMYIQAIADAQI